MAKWTKTSVTSAALVALLGEPAMAGMHDPPPLILWGMPFNHATIVHAAIAALAVYLLVRLLTMNLSREHPRRGQVILEMERLGFGNGWSQDAASAQYYNPDFDRQSPFLEE